MGYGCVLGKWACKWGFAYARLRSERVVGVGFGGEERGDEGGRVRLGGELEGKEGGKEFMREFCLDLCVGNYAYLCIFTYTHIIFLSLFFRCFFFVF